MILKYPVTYIGALFLVVGGFLALRQQPTIDSEYSWFVARFAEDLYESDPAFRKEEKAVFLEWYIKGFLNGYHTHQYYGSVDRQGPQWAGFQQGRYYKRKYPDSTNKVMNSFGYRKVRGTGIWDYGFEHNVFRFHGDGEIYELVPMGIVMPYFDQTEFEPNRVELNVEGFIGPKDKDVYGYFKKYKHEIYFKTLFLTALEANKPSDQIASSSAAHD